jgi:integrase
MMARIKYKYVHSDIDRNGNVRYYFYRRGAEKKIRLRGLPGSREFREAYEAALEGRAFSLSAPETPHARPDQQTLDWLCAAFYQSAGFKGLAKGTQENTRAQLRSVANETISPQDKRRVGELPFHSITTRAIRDLRDRRADMPNAANHRLSALRAVFKWAAENERMASNPAKDVKKIEIHSDGHHTWTTEEIQQFETCHPIGTQPRLALALAAYTGQRRSDIVRLGPQHRTRDGNLRFTQKKNEDRNPVVVTIPILPELQAIIDATPSHHLTFLVNDRGQSWSAKSFGNKFREWCDMAGLRHCSVHGLRKAAASLAAERGASEMQLMAIFGWQDADMARVYTRRASRSKMALSAMHLLGNDQNKEGSNVSHFRVGEKLSGNKTAKNP